MSTGDIQEMRRREEAVAVAKKAKDNPLLVINVKQGKI